MWWEFISAGRSHTVAIIIPWKLCKHLNGHGHLYDQLKKVRSLGAGPSISVVSKPFQVIPEWSQVWEPELRAIRVYQNERGWKKALHGLIGSRPLEASWGHQHASPQSWHTSVGTKPICFRVARGGPREGGPNAPGSNLLKGLISLCATKSLNMSAEAICFKTKDFSKNRLE